MATCKWCKQTFDVEEAAVKFKRGSWLLTYDKLSICLCGDCAIRASNIEEHGVYFETCTDCGRKFDLVEEEAIFQKNAA